MTVAEWKAAVYQHRGLPASVRLLLVYLADHMAEDLTVSIPQSDLCEGLGLWRQHVSERVKMAVEAGLLRIIEPARGRRPAIYEATRRGTDPVTSTVRAQTHSSSDVYGRRGTTLGASTVRAQTHSSSDVYGRRGTDPVTSTRDVLNTHQLPLEDSPSPYLQLLVLDEDAETAPDSVTHGQVLHGSTSPAVSRRVGGPGGGIERPDVEALCRHLADRIESNGSKRPTITKAWRDEACRMLDNDKRPLDQAHQLIDWCQDHDFWVSKILGMPKFRKQYDQLRLQRERDRRPRTKQSGPTDEYLKDAYARAAAYDEARGL